MTTRRDQRQTHVRPRPPSTGRPLPARVKPRNPVPTRVPGHRPPDRGRGTPLAARFGLIVTVGVLGVLVLYIGTAGFGNAIGGLGSAVSGFIGGVTATPTPKPSVVGIAQPPSLALPVEPYTAESTVDLRVTVPNALVGRPDYRLRVYLALPGTSPTALEEVRLGTLPQTVIPVELTDGVNDFSVTLVGPGGESEHSAVARYVFDSAPPKITITSPADGAVVNHPAVDVKGKTQARTTLIARNADNGSSVTTNAGADGSFGFTIAITNGSNEITITGTDPAGNTSLATVAVQRGSGALKVVLGSSTNQIKQGSLPEPVTLTATVTDPDGVAVAGAPLTFTLGMPGIPTVTSETTTNATGEARFETTVPAGAAIGDGNATVLVVTDQFGSTQDDAVIKIVE